MGLLSWLRRFWGDASEPEVDLAEDDTSAVDGDATTEREAEASAFEPPAAHARILARVRREAEADAVRHAEDMLDRQFPVRSEAEATAAGRLAALRAEFLNRDAELRGRRADREQQIAAVTRGLAAIEAALRDAGVPPDQMDLEPVRARRLSDWRIVAGLAIGGALGYLVAAGDLSTPWLVVSVVVALALLSLLFVAPSEDLEDREIATLRERHAESSEALVELNSEIARIEIEREALRAETASLARGEAAFAEQIAATYLNAAFSAMPAGSLADGQAFATQQALAVELPDWVAELEGPE